MELMLYFEDDKSTENVDGSVAIPRKIHFITIVCVNGSVAIPRQIHFITIACFGLVP